MDLITSLTSQVMHKALDGLSKRHKAIASNLANVDTPNYRRRDVSFEAALAQAVEQASQGGARQTIKQASNDVALPLKTTRPEHFAIPFNGSLDDFQPQIVEDGDLQYRNDGNAVDVESEMVQLAKNTQKYLAITNLEGRTIKGLRSVINGGGS